MFIIFWWLDNADEKFEPVHEASTICPVHPLGVQTSINPGGAPFMSESTILFLGKINIGEIYVPAAFMVHRTLTVWLFSPLVIRLSRYRCSKGNSHILRLQSARSNEKSSCYALMYFLWLLIFAFVEYCKFGQNQNLYWAFEPFQLMKLGTWPRLSSVGSALAL